MGKIGPTTQALFALGSFQTPLGFRVMIEFTNILCGTEQVLADSCAHFDNLRSFISTRSKLYDDWMCICRLQCHWFWPGL